MAVKKYKLKTRKGAAKRFKKVTANGEIKRGQEGHGHFLSRRGRRKAHKLAGSAYVDSANFDMIAKLLPTFGAKRKRTKHLKKVAAQASAAKQEA